MVIGKEKSKRKAGSRKKAVDFHERIVEAQERGTYEKIHGAGSSSRSRSRYSCGRDGIPAVIRRQKTID
jgi:hypothetical protein